MSTADRKSPQALAGVRVIGLTNWLSGAYAEQLLADMGAEVIRVERPGTGDDARQAPPFHHGVSTTYLYPNRNKKSVTLNLKDPRGADLLKQLVAGADVLIENQRPGMLERLGLGYDVLSQANPALVMTSISGFGQTGPYRQQPAYDMNIQAITGLMSLTGMPDGPPVRAGVAISDYLAGLNAAYATLAAFIHRGNTGEGQHVDVSLFESTVAVFGTALQDYLLMGKARSRAGNRFGPMAPTNIYPCLDGWMLLTVGNEAQWSRLIEVLDLQACRTDPRFDTVEHRVTHHDELDALVTPWTKVRTVKDAVGLLTTAGVPAGPVNTVADLVADPQFKSRGIAVEVEDPAIGRLPLVAAMPRLSRTPGQVKLPPPVLGQHNAEVYSSLLGLDEAHLAELQTAGVI
ncbi:MAG: CoA transferase [Rubrivivax sp.]